MLCGIAREWCHFMWFSAPPVVIVVSPSLSSSSPSSISSMVHRKMNYGKQFQNVINIEGINEGKKNCISQSEMDYFISEREVRTKHIWSWSGYSSLATFLAFNSLRFVESKQKMLFLVIKQEMEQKINYFCVCFVWFRPFAGDFCAHAIQTDDFVARFSSIFVIFHSVPLTIN